MSQNDWVRAAVQAYIQTKRPKCLGGNMKAILSAPLALALTTLVMSSMHAETLDQLYAKAKAEGALNIYGGGPARLYEGWIKEYEASFPGIKVTLTGGYAGGLAPAIDKQIAAKKLEVDFEIGRASCRERV